MSESNDDYSILLKKNLTDDVIQDLSKENTTKIKLSDETFPLRYNYSFDSILVRSNSAKIIFLKSWKGRDKGFVTDLSYEYKCKKNRAEWSCSLVKLARSDS